MGCMVGLGEFPFYVESQPLTFMLPSYFFDTLNQVIFVFDPAFLVIFDAFNGLPQANLP